MIRRVVKILVLAGVALLPVIFFSCGRRGAEPLVYTGYLPGAPLVKIAVARRSESVAIGAEADFELRGERSGRLLDSGGRLRDVKVSALRGELLIDGAGTRVRGMKLTTMTDGTLRVNGVKYRGELSVYVDGNEGVTVVETVGLERYLAGVLGKEVYLTWPDAALEAQAVAARTYALYRIRTRDPGAPYDMAAGYRHSQEYGGVNAETSVSRAIMEETRGVILTYEWRLFSAYYHSVCGGHTRSVEAVFGEPEIMPLSGVPCDFCSGAKGYRWSAELSAREIEDGLARVDVRLGDIRDVRATDGGGFWVEIEGSEGSRRMRAQDFRLAVGSKKIKSPKFVVRRQGSGFVFEGKGFGHGVGMCQWGAEGMARRGYSSTEILKHFYPGVEVVRVY
jgi:stage II sporulation protein D